MELAKSLPQIIKESAGSPLGILALTIIGLAILAFFFFRQASEKTRIGIFVGLFLGVVVLAGTVVRVSKSTSGPQPTPTNGPIVRPHGGPKGPANNVETNSKELAVSTQDFRTQQGTYRILSATLDQLSEDSLTLDFLIRYTRGDDWSGGTLMAENFRLFADDVPLAPKTAPSEAVSVNSAKEGHVIFTIPSATKKVVLQVGVQKEVRKISVDLTATR